MGVFSQLWAAKPNFARLSGALALCLLAPWSWAEASDDGGATYGIVGQGPAPSTAASAPVAGSARAQSADVPSPQAANDAVAVPFAENAAVDAPAQTAPEAAEPVSSGLSCIESFHETRSRVLGNNLQSVIMLSSTNGVAPYITLQTKSADERRYILWQTLNGEIRGYALRDGKGFDYTNSAGTPLPLSWHPTLIWDNLFNSNKEPRNYSCVLTGRTRVMGKRVSLLRLIPQEGLRYSYMIAKEDESDFPVELTIIDHEGKVASRLTVMDSRIITGVTFPVSDAIFDRLAQTQLQPPSSLGQNSSLTGTVHDDTVAQEAAAEGIWQAHNFSDRVEQQGPAATARLESDSIQLVLPEPTESAGATVEDGGLSDGVQSHHGLNNALPLQRWPELNIPTVYNIVGEGHFDEGGPDCIYQEYSDGLTSFRVYRNRLSTIYYPVLTNGTITIVRKQNSRYEYSVVGEVPVNLAEFVLARIGAQ